MAGLGEPFDGSRHEGAPDAFSPMGGIDIAAVHLAERLLPVVSAGTSGQKPGQLAIDLADEHEVPLGLSAKDDRLPAQCALEEPRAEGT